MEEIKDIIRQMDKAFDSRVRIGIMAILLPEQWVDFNELKTKLGVTDGNLASHMSSLERKKFIEIHKQFVGKRPNTSYKITAKGKEGYAKYLVSLKKLLNIKQ
jgi:predicted ArsR family transcriptional regulator